MTTRGRIRGNGSQLADYLLTKGDNESVQVFDIRGTSQPDNLKKSLIEMSLSSELSGRTDKGLYQVVINPRPGEDWQMTAADWFRAAEMIEEENGYTGQARAMVLHEKKGRLHMHVVWERFNHRTGKMIDNQYSRFGQDRARKRMEREFGHMRTPDRNQERPELRKLLSGLWQEHADGRSFVSALADHGYTVAKTEDRRPFVIVNERGMSFDLDRELKDVRVREIKAKLKGVALPEKKKTIAAVKEKRKSRQVAKSVSAKAQKIEELKKQLQQSLDKEKDRGR